MRKKLIEVALPLDAINAAAAREKSIRHGHPSTLHLWWARRPLAACRAVLFASLVDDPDSDPAYRRPDGSVDTDRAGVKRAALFDLIEELVRWENSNNPRVIEQARAEIARCVASRKIETGELKKDAVVHGPRKGQAHPRGPVSGEGVTAWDVCCRAAPPEVVNAFLAEHAPPVLDPFCGGGSIPLEAQRLGLVAHASDLNPVAVLITKALIEIPPKFAGRPPVNPEARRKPLASYPGATGLAEDVRYYGKWMRDEAEKRIGHLYPRGPKLEPVIAWLWARTIECPNPACRITVPLIKSYALCTKPSRPTRLIPILDLKSRRMRFDIGQGRSRVGDGTVSRKGAICPACQTPIPYRIIREAGRAGQMGSQLLATVCEGSGRRTYHAATEEHELAALTETPGWRPDVSMADNPFSLRPPLYGLETFADLFSCRQLCAMTTFAELARELGQRLDDQAVEPAYRNALVTYVGMSVSRLANRCSSACFWDPGGEKIQQVFGRQAIAMAWDYVEANPLSDASGGFIGQVEYLANAIANLPFPVCEGEASQHDATKPHPAGEKRVILATDPPYYDNIDYADLSDFFYVWLRPMLREVHPALFATVAVPKAQELVATPYRFEGDRDRANQHFTDGTRMAFTELARVLTVEVPATIVYGFKQQEELTEAEGEVRVSTGWETFLESLRQSGMLVTGTWPLRTELVGNLKGKMNALASSIVLVCRPRPADAPLATRKQFITALRAELPDALRNLQHGNIAPVDLAQAAIGPGMAVFTRYAKVIEADGSPMRVRTALQLINQALDEVLAEQEGEFDADTRWALAWFEQHGMADGPFGTAETLSKAKDTAVGALVESGLVVARAGKVRLVRRDELLDEWDPAADRRLTVWEATQHLIHALDRQGESGAADLLRRLGGTAETARDLAYRLYTVCERKKWAEEALAYNGLVLAWPELTKLAQAASGDRPPVQQTFAD